MGGYKRHSLADAVIDYAPRYGNKSNTATAPRLLERNHGGVEPPLVLDRPRDGESAIRTHPDPHEQQVRRDHDQNAEHAREIERQISG